MMPTYCDECDNVTMETRKHHPSRWTCIKFPRLEGFSPVSRKAWVDCDPYGRCTSINHGHCPVWAKRRDGQQDNGL